MARTSGRSFLATVVMWVVIGLVAWWLVGWILVPFRFVVRLVLTLIVIGLLVTLVSRLGDDDGD